jgi:hypothetical protein
MSVVERTPAGLQTVIAGCEQRTLPKSTTRADESGQGLLHFYKPSSLREELARRADAPLQPRRGQKALPKSGLFAFLDQPRPHDRFGRRLGSPIRSIRGLGMGLARLPEVSAGIV